MQQEINDDAESREKQQQEQQLQKIKYLDTLGPIFVELLRLEKQNSRMLCEILDFIRERSGH